MSDENIDKLNADLDECLAKFGELAERRSDKIKRIDETSVKVVIVAARSLARLDAQRREASYEDERYNVHLNTLSQALPESLRPAPAAPAVTSKPNDIPSDNAPAHPSGSTAVSQPPTPPKDDARKENEKQSWWDTVKSTAREQHDKLTKPKSDKN